MYCAQCGTANAEDARFCTQCGAALAPPGAAAVAQEAPYAGFWIRVGAYLIDALILTLASFVLGFAVAFLGRPESESGGLVMLLSIAGTWLYNALLESGEHQATWGKRAVGIKVTQLDGNRISFGRATGRYFAQFLSSLTLCIGYICVAFTKRRQALHDLIAGTYVVRATATPEHVATSGPAPRMAGWAIALVILGACVVPMTGILAAIAIPAYQDYTIRAQVSEGLMAASDVKAAVAEYVAQTGDWPMDNVEAGLGSSEETATLSGRYFEAIDVSNGTIYITYGGEANQRLQGNVLALRPFVDVEGNVVWQCGNANEPVEAYSNSGGASGEGTESDLGGSQLPDKHVPTACRTNFGGT